MIMPSVRPPDESGAGPLAMGPTIWGLEPSQLHDRFWASRGVQVVRQGEPAELAAHAPFYLLMEPRALAIFDAAPAEDAMAQMESDLMYVRVHDTREHGYRERVVTDDKNRFVRFERLYDRPHSHLARAAFTREIRIARLWQSAPSPRNGWRLLRGSISKDRRSTVEAGGMLYDGFLDNEVAAFVRDLTRYWSRPDCTIARAQQLDDGIWKDRDASVDATARIVGPVWIGAGRHADPGTMVVGPAVLWDDPKVRPAPEPIAWAAAPWRDIVPELLPPAHPSGNPALADSLAQARRLHNLFKRGFDIAFSLCALVLTLPLYPFIILAIVIEDGMPIFFAHRRETIGGREFPCIKFRSMRRNAEQMKLAIKQHNQADGPQFYMENDPRLTRVGRVLRKFRFDELPQFFNVLVGHMSVVGPRPSPFKENQFCPAWREARLSIRPGITGLWQIKRTRAPGTDFQEWIRYDIEYVENARWSLDLLIIWKTIFSVLHGSDQAKRDSRNDGGSPGKARQTLILKRTSGRPSEYR